MAGMCRVEIIGHVGQNAELKYGSDGQPFLSFSVAHSPRVKQGQAERTMWLRCTLFGKQGESLQQYLVKGKQVYVRGDLDIREYTNRDNNLATSIDVFVKEVELIGPRVEGQQQAPRQQPKQDNSGFGDGFGDESEIPF